MIQTVITMQPYSETINLLRQKYNYISEEGCFFAVVSSEYDNKGNVVHDFLEVIFEAEKAGYDYVNTIVYPTTDVQKAAFTDNVRYVVWLAKNHKKMVFDKDSIREKHIWKDVEWGKREKNYNPKGKDPGNVWIPTNDDGNAHITEHILLSDEDIIKRIITMSNCGANYEIFRGKLTCRNISENINKYRPEVLQKQVSGKVVFKTSEDMDRVENDSVSLAVTSPPYWNLKDYFKEGQIGQEDYTKYLCRIKKVWGQCYKKLNANGSLWININIRTRNGKSILIPKDFIDICRELGFFYKGIFIWHKSSGIPTSDKNIVDRHEYVLVFAKSENFFVDKEVQGSFCDYKNALINGGVFWNINRKAGSVGKKYIHPAIYPNELVERIIKLSTNLNELVLDPFLGSGTSLISALNCGRNFIGYEYNEGFRELMQSRFDAELDAGADIMFI